MRSIPRNTSALLGPGVSLNERKECAVNTLAKRRGQAIKIVCFARSVCGKGRASSRIGLRYAAEKYKAESAYVSNVFPILFFRRTHSFWTHSFICSFKSSLLSACLPACGQFVCLFDCLSHCPSHCLSHTLSHSATVFHQWKLMTNRVQTQLETRPRFGYKTDACGNCM